MSPIPTPKTIMEDIRRGNEVSWDKFQKHYEPLIHYCGHQSDLAPDEIKLLIQNVMLAFFNISKEFVYDPSKGRFRTYLGRIIRSCVCRIIRERGGIGISDDTADAPVESELEKKIEEDHRKFTFYQAFQQVRENMPLRMVQAFIFCEFKHQPVESVAKFLGVSPATVYNDKMKVLEELKRLVRILHDDNLPGDPKP